MSLNWAFDWHILSLQRVDLFLRTRPLGGHSAPEIITITTVKNNFFDFIHVIKFTGQVKTAHPQKGYTDCTIWNGH